MKYSLEFVCFAAAFGLLACAPGGSIVFVLATAHADTPVACLAPEYIFVAFSPESSTSFHFSSLDSVMTLTCVNAATGVAVGESLPINALSNLVGQVLSSSKYIFWLEAKGNFTANQGAFVPHFVDQSLRVHALPVLACPTVVSPYTSIAYDETEDAFFVILAQSHIDNVPAIYMWSNVSGSATLSHVGDIVIYGTLGRTLPDAVWTVTPTTIVGLATVDNSDSTSLNCHISSGSTCVSYFVIYDRKTGVSTALPMLFTLAVSLTYDPMRDVLVGLVLGHPDTHLNFAVINATTGELVLVTPLADPSSFTSDSEACRFSAALPPVWTNGASGELVNIEYCTPHEFTSSLDPVAVRLVSRDSNTGVVNSKVDLADAQLPGYYGIAAFLPPAEV